MILRGFLHFYDEIFNLPGFLQDPCLIVGRQCIEAWPGRPPAYDFPTVKAMLQARGVREAVEVDLFDPAADLHLDLNQPFPPSLEGRFGTVFDAGTVEHIFDTATALGNCLGAVRPAGFCTFHTPVKGYFLHGLHVFSPELLPFLLARNGFELLYLKYSTPDGTPAALEADVPDLLQWVVARKPPGRGPGPLEPVQQRLYETWWDPGEPADRTKRP